MKEKKTRPFFKLISSLTHACVLHQDIIICVGGSLQDVNSLLDERIVFTLNAETGKLILEKRI